METVSAAAYLASSEKEYQDTHKEEARARIESDKARHWLRKNMDTCINHLNPDIHPEQTVNPFASIGRKLRFGSR